MNLTLIAVGRGMPKPVAELVADYQSRLKRFGKCPLVEIREEKVTGSPTERQKALVREADRIKKKIPPGAFTVALDLSGKALSSEELSQQMSKWRDQGQRDLVFIIGGADGLDRSLVEACSYKLSLGKPTWPHMLARVLILEQLFRANAIQKGIPYHR